MAHVLTMNDPQRMPSRFVLGTSEAPSRETRLRQGTVAFTGLKTVSITWRLLVEALPEKAPGAVLLVRDPAGVLALAARALWPAAPVTVHHMDAFEARGAAATLVRNGVSVDEVLAADLPPGPFDLVALPCPARSEALLSRDLIEQAHDALVVGGRLLVATDRGHAWLRKVVKEVFGKADLQAVHPKGGAVVHARRLRDTPRRRDHAHALQVPRGDRVLSMLTRPGVFSPGRLDAGTKALLASFQAAPGSRVLDLGCGHGVLGLAAAVDAGASGVVLVDSNARATDLARRNADTNGLPAVQVVLRADLEDIPGGPFDRVLANPPYFSNGRIATAFVRTAASLLTPDGVLSLVAKAKDFHRTVLEAWFDEVDVSDVQDYGVFEARKPRAGVESESSVESDAAD